MLDIPRGGGALDSNEDKKRVYKLVLTGGKLKKIKIVSLIFFKQLKEN